MKAVWFPAINKWHDQTRTAHILNDKGMAVCGARPFAYGGGSERIEDTGASACGGCMKFLKHQSKKES